MKATAQTRSQPSRSPRAHILTGPPRAAVVLALGLLAVSLSGCIDAGAQGPPTTHPVHPGPVCTDRCSVFIEDGETRSHESSVARNPHDPDHLLVGASAWLRDETVDSCLLTGTPAETCVMIGPVQLWRHVSFDGGKTWDSAPFPGDVPPDHPLVAPAIWADPNVAFLSDGTALYVGMYGKGGEAFDIFLARSSDGGLTWPEATIIAGEISTIAGTPSTPLGPSSSVMDQPFLAVGPDDTLLAGWTWYYDHGFERKDVVVAVSDDRGVTWSEPVHLSGDCDCSNARPVIAPDGSMYVAYRDRGVPHAAAIWLARSDDGGASWETWQIPGLHATEYVDLAVHEGTLIMAYTEADLTGNETTYLLRSEDGGLTLTWLELRTGLWKNDPNRVGSIGPALDVSPDGTAFVVEYVLHEDARMDVVGIRISPHGVVVSQTLTEEPLGENRYLGSFAAVGGPEWSVYGDYSGLYADKHGAIATWVGGDPDRPDLIASFFDLPRWNGGDGPPGLANRPDRW